MSDIDITVLTGDENGLVKHVNLHARNYVILGTQQMSRTLAVKGLCPHDTSIGSQSIASVLRMNGELELWDMSTQLNKISLGLADPVGALSVKHASRLSVLSFGESGNVFINSLNDELNSYAPSSSQRWSIRSPLSTAAYCNDGGVVFGGKENDLMMYDINTQDVVWEAINVPDDWLKMRVPIYVTAVKFMKPLEDSISGAHIVTGTGHKHVRLYDTRASQQPVLSIDTSDEFRVTSIQPSPDTNYVYVGKFF